MIIHFSIERDTFLANFRAERHPFGNISASTYEHIAQHELHGFLIFWIVRYETQSWEHVVFANLVRKEILYD